MTGLDDQPLEKGTWFSGGRTYSAARANEDFLHEVQIFKRGRYCRARCIRMPALGFGLLILFYKLDKYVF
jgi:hypothetical protein